jgi:hypothetical protein
MGTTTKITEGQSQALMLAYSDQYILYGCADEFDGTSPASLRAVLRKGWVRPVDMDDPEDELEITEAGRVALGVPGVLKAPPKRMKTAMVRALGHFLTPAANLRSPDAIFPPAKLSGAVWANDEQRADFSEALLLVDMDAAGLTGFEELDWSCAARLVTELGFPCTVSCMRHIQAFWPDED